MKITAPLPSHESAPVSHKPSSIACRYISTVQKMPNRSSNKAIA
jgi:hypothetical protein